MPPTALDHVQWFPFAKADCRKGKIDVYAACTALGLAPSALFGQLVGAGVAVAQRGDFWFVTLTGTPAVAVYERTLPPRSRRPPFIETLRRLYERGAGAWIDDQTWSVEGGALFDAFAAAPASTQRSMRRFGFCLRRNRRNEAPRYQIVHPHLRRDACDWGLVMAWPNSEHKPHTPSPEDAAPAAEEATGEETPRTAPVSPAATSN